MLGWARTRRGLPVKQVAQKLRVSPDKILAWEAGEHSPTPRQARLLASCYGRPFLEFFASVAPEIPEVTLVPDFRFFSSGPDDGEILLLQQIHAWAEEQRLNALALFDELGDKPQHFPTALSFRASDDVEDAAIVARNEIGFQIEDQLQLSSSQRALLPMMLREKFEAVGMLVLKHSSLRKCRARGICLFADPLPVVVFGNESPTAQAFTLSHEFAHAILKSSGISGAPRFGSNRLKGNKAIENWCNRFAAAFLIPELVLTQLERQPSQPFKDFDLSRLSQLAQIFSVSRHTILIRLVNLGYVASSFYWRKMRPVFMKEESEHKSFGKSPYYAKRHVNSKGILYTNLVLEAWTSGIITSHNAGEYMGVTKLSHLQSIREDFGL